MKPKKNYKHYIYIRDNQRCYFCNRKVDYKKMSLDHYQPKSKGGSDNLFNVVTSCSSCNKNKGTDLPNDFKHVQIELFKRAVADKVYNINLTSEVTQIKTIDSKTCQVYSEDTIFTIREDKIVKIHQYKQL